MTTQIEEVSWSALSVFRDEGASDIARAECGIILLLLIGNDALPDLSELPCPLDCKLTKALWFEMRPILDRLALVAREHGVDPMPLLQNWGARYYTELDCIQNTLDLLRVLEAAPTPDKPKVGGGGEGVDHRDVVAALEEMRRKGEPFTGYRDLGRRFECHGNTIKKAINASPILQGWRARHKPEHAAALKSTSMAVAECEGVSQTRELDPFKAAMDAEAEETAQAAIDRLAKEQSEDRRRDQRFPSRSRQGAYVRTGR
jgi:hypothetical protein